MAESGSEGCGRTALLGLAACALAWLSLEVRWQRSAIGHTGRIDLHALWIPASIPRPNGTHTGAAGHCSIYTYNSTRLEAMSLPSWRGEWLPSAVEWVNDEFRLASVDCKDRADRRIASHGITLGAIATHIMNRTGRQLLREDIYVVNIGAAASFGGNLDPTYSVLTLGEHVAGLLVDLQTDESLFHKYPKRSNVIQRRGTEMYPDTIVATLEAAGAPRDLGVLKVDIDSFDCDMAQAILAAGFRPALIHMEFNPVFGPHVSFRVSFVPNQTEYSYSELWRVQGPFYGCSLAAQAALLVPQGYSLLQIEYWDAVWVRDDVVPHVMPLPASLAVAYAEGLAKPVYGFSECWSSNAKVYTPVEWLPLVTIGGGGSPAVLAIETLLERDVSTPRSPTGSIFPHFLDFVDPRLTYVNNSCST